MKLLTALKAERSVTLLLAEPDSNTQAAKKALRSLQKAGPGALPIIIDSLGAADKFQTIGIVALLSDKVSEQNIKYFIDGLKHSNQRCVSGVASAMSSSDTFNPNKLFKYTDHDEISKPAVLDILRAHSEKLNVREALKMAYLLEPQDQTAMFGLVRKLTTEDLIPDLIARLKGNVARRSARGWRRLTYDWQET